MKNIFFKIGLFLILISTLMINRGCTDLKEEIYSDITPDNFFKTELEGASALGESYLRLQNWIQIGFFQQELAADALTIPSRGTDWNENGMHRIIHKHTWDNSHSNFSTSWNFYFAGVSTTNRLIFQFEDFNFEKKDNYIAELRGLRALFYLQLIDQFGNVPIVTKFDVPDDYLPANNTRKEIYDFIENEIIEIQDLLSKEVGGAFYGRVNYYTAQAILAKLYMNAEVYSGTPQWKKAVQTLDNIINSGKFTLASNYYDNFIAENQGSPEFIFAIPYDEIFFGGNNWHLLTLHYESQATYKMTAQPWNGFCVMEDYYNTYEKKDLRIDNFIEGFQYTFEGEPLLDHDYEVGRDPDGAHINFTPKIENFEDALRQEGVRIGKWEFPIGTKWDLNNDFPIFRYADILMLKAEALFWQGETTGEALELVNSIRKRAGLEDNLFTMLTKENLLAERGREFFSELFRRSDLIRFGVFNDAWWEHPEDPSSHLNIYPIPRDQIDANPNLKQNFGY